MSTSRHPSKRLDHLRLLVEATHGITGRLVSPAYIDFIATCLSRQLSACDRQTLAQRFDHAGTTAAPAIFSRMLEDAQMLGQR